MVGVRGQGSGVKGQGDEESTFQPTRSLFSKIKRKGQRGGLSLEEEGVCVCVVEEGQCSITGKTRLRS